MNPLDPKNIANGRSMDVKSGSQSPQTYPQSNQPTNSVQPQSSVMAPADDIAQATNAPGMIPPPEKKSKRMSTKILAILLISIGLVLVVLLGVGIYVYSKEPEEPVPVNNTSLSEDPVNSERVTTTEIDTVITEIDATLNTVDDATDFKPDDLNDGNLGI